MMNDPDVARLLLEIGEKFQELAKKIHPNVETNCGRMCRGGDFCDTICTGPDTY